MERSIELPHCWHIMSSDALMRAIVWWVPQSGHWDTSSKRRRQYTHLNRPGSWVGRSQGSPQPGHGGRRSSVPIGSSSTLTPAVS